MGILNKWSVNVINLGVVFLALGAPIGGLALQPDGHFLKDEVQAFMSQHICQLQITDQVRNSETVRYLNRELCESELSRYAPAWGPAIYGLAGIKITGAIPDRYQDKSILLTMVSRGTLRKMEIYSNDYQTRLSEASSGMGWDGQEFKFTFRNPHLKMTVVCEARANSCP